MAQEKKHIHCPNCGQIIDVNQILYHQLQEEIKKDYAVKLSEQKKQFDSKQEILNKEKEELESQKATITETINKSVKDKLALEKKELENKLRSEISSANSEEIKSLQDELKAKSNEVIELSKTKGELARVKREKEELSAKISAEAEEKLTAILKDERLKLQSEMDNKLQFKISEKDALIAALDKQLKEAQRKVEQGSMQLQGEVQELAIEEWLNNNFPLDTIEEIKKGARGADCVQIVNAKTGRNSGSIYYESKRTKDFQPSWIEKFKVDMREKGATFGVIVTEALPKDMSRLGQKEGVWICSFEEFKGLSFVLREAVVLLGNSRIVQENKGDKMNMLYDYLTGNEFRMQVEAIVEGFSQMNNDLITEKRAMEGIWKKREKQIQKVILNTTHMYSSIRGIAGSAIGTIKALELPEENEIDKNSKTNSEFDELKFD